MFNVMQQIAHASVVRMGKARSHTSDTEQTEESFFFIEPEQKQQLDEAQVPRNSSAATETIFDAIKNPFLKEYSDILKL